MSLLEIKDLHARTAEDQQPILSGVDLSVPPGEVHVIMGPNGSGKSTLAKVLAGHPGYEVTGGQVRYAGRDLLDLSPEDRAGEGLFLAFQYPVEIPGVANAYFLRSALNALRARRGQEDVDAFDFLALVRDKAKLLDMPQELLNRPVNDGFSGGEKKRNEMLQMLVLEPRLAILDETDSGLDVDALQLVARAVNATRAADRSILLITHYQRLLQHITPDRVHVLAAGRVVRSGGPELAEEVEAGGFGWIEQAQGTAQPTPASSS